jgi:hypothetical protein
MEQINYLVPKCQNRFSLSSQSFFLSFAIFSCGPSKKICIYCRFLYFNFIFLSPCRFGVIYLVESLMPHFPIQMESQ